ncbi:hypothetical protein PRIPAC_77092, partial [Pristionchus pacificus]|uniref:Uncharacterized protein n=1 Tax=Pristionchus pacificus TaxID=54126 RepID=A0A2A6BYR4_PRIPA
MYYGSISIGIKMAAGSSLPANNFRQSLISKVVSKVDESAKLEELLSGDRDIDIFQLKQFVWKYCLPDKQRLNVWRLLLGVSSGHQEMRSTIDRHRNDEAESLWRSLRTMRLNDGREGPVPSDIVRMILLSRGHLRKGVDFRTHDIAPIVTIVHHMRMVAGLDGWKEAFSLSRAAHQLFINLFPSHVIHHIHKEVSKRVETDASVVVVSLLNLKMYMQSGGAALFKSTKALQKLWDKILSGGESRKSPPYLMTQLLISYFNLLSAKSNCKSPLSNVIRRDIPTNLDSAVPSLGYQSVSSQSALKDLTATLSEEEEIRLVNLSTEAVLRKPNFKMPDPPSSCNSLNGVHNASSLAWMIRGETVRRSDGFEFAGGKQKVCHRKLSGFFNGLSGLVLPTPTSRSSIDVHEVEVMKVLLNGATFNDDFLKKWSGYVTPSKARDGKDSAEETPRKRASTMSEAKLRSLPI